MLALGLWRDGRCRGCGGDLAETTSPEHSGDPGKHTFRPLPPVRCHRCTGLAESEHAYREARHPHALIHRVELQPPRRRLPS